MNRIKTLIIGQTCDFDNINKTLCIGHECQEIFSYYTFSERERLNESLYLPKPKFFNHLKMICS